MSLFSLRTSAKMAAVATLTAGALFAAPAAFAAETPVTATVAQGAFTADTAVSASLASVTSSHQGGVSNGGLTLTVDNSTGTLDGWSVSQQVTDFAYTGTNAGTAIGAANFSVTPGTVTGSATGSLVIGAAGSLDQGRIVLSAPDGTDTIGVNQLQLDAALTVPADSRVGTYEGTLTTTVSVAPAV